jgi:predicted RecA/RadA family phage recombinase
MAIEAQLIQAGEVLNWTADADYSAGDVIQLSDGRAGFVTVDVTSGNIVGVQVTGVVKTLKTTSMVLLAGGRAYWDHSANKAHYKKVNDRDFYLGRVTADAASADTVCYVALNVDPPYDIDALRDGALSVATGTAAAGGFGLPAVYGGALGLSLTSTSEVQCVDILSVDRFAVGANAIVEAIFRIGVNGSTSAVDFNVGVANGTSTSDADAITESCFIHVDGGATDLLAESDDGTTEVAATDTTVDFTAGSAVANRVEAWFDLRDPADIQVYVNGALVLGSTVFKLDAATGPLGLLAHLEKSTGTATAGPIYIDALRARFQQ